MNNKFANLILKKDKVGNIKALIFLYCCLCLCSCDSFKKDITKAGEWIKEVGHEIWIPSEIVDATWKTIETVGKKYRRGGH
jgi:hypothetical protein